MCYSEQFVCWAKYVRMGRPGLTNSDVSYEASRRNRKSAALSGENLKLKTSDYNRFMQKFSKKNVDEDYLEYLKLSFKYDTGSLAYTNECGNDGRADEVEAEDEDEAVLQYKMFDGSTEGVEIEDEDEADPQYQMFLSNAKPDGKSYVVKVDTEDGFPMFLKYEKECGCNYQCEGSGCKKQKDIEMQKNDIKQNTLLNISSEDVAECQRLSKPVPKNNSNRPMGDEDVIYEPFDPLSQRKNGIMSRKLSMGKSGASRRQGKRGTKTKSGEEQMIVVNFTGKEKASDVDEDYMIFLEDYKRKNRGMKASLRNGSSFEYECAEDEIEILDNSNATPKNVEDRCPQIKSGASKRQGKCGTKTKSGEEQMIVVNFTGEEKSSDVDEDYMRHVENLNRNNWGMKAPLRNGCSFEYESAEDDIEILDNNIGTLKTCSAKYPENVEDGCPRISVLTEFRQKVTDLLKRPYNPFEYEKLWTKVNSRKLMERNIELRNGEVKNYKTQQMGKSYLDYYEDLNKKLNEFDKDNRKKLRIMRGFFFWLQNLTHADAFQPWKDAEFLKLVAESS